MADVMAPPSVDIVDDRKRDRSSDRRRERSPGRRDRDERNIRDDRPIRDDRIDRRRGDYNERRQDDRGDKRDRERDPKRRRSNSPSFRDRRHSPKRHAHELHNFPGRGSRGAPYPPQADWPRPGRSGFDVPPASFPNNSMFTGPPPKRINDGLMSFKQFMAELEEDISPSEAERRYEAYKRDYIITQKEEFFSQHKEEDWLREKYDPTRLESFLQRRNENALNAAKEFVGELQNGILDLGPSALGGKGGRDNEEDNAAKRRRSGGNRVSSRDRDEAAAPKAPMAASNPERVAKDLEQSRELAAKLDAEKGIVDSPPADAAGAAAAGVPPADATPQVKGSMAAVLAQAIPRMEGLELLDVIITYLWRVHGLDYYGAAELKGLPRGFRHVRASQPQANGEQEDPESISGWEKRIDAKWQSRLKPEAVDPLVAMLGRDRMETATASALESLVRKIKDEKYGWKYGCGAKGCTKLFHGPEFVHKHLKLKHVAAINDALGRFREELYHDNYINDPDGPVPGITPGFSARPNQQSLQPGRDRGPKRAPPLLEGEPPAGRRGGPGPGDRFVPREFPDHFDRPRELDGEQFDDRYDRPSLDGERFDREPPLPRDRFDRGPPLRGPLPPEGFDRDDQERFDRPPPPPMDRGLGPRENEMYDLRPVDGQQFEGVGMDDERFERGPPMDVGFLPPIIPPPLFDGGDGPSFDGPPLEPVIYDPFDGGPPLRPPPHFGAGGAPPMLIPVPGAGPLGPFVPAPPDVAMRMMREGGGPRGGVPPPFFSGFDGGGFDPPFDVDGLEGPPPMDRRGGRMMGGRGRGRGREGSPPGGGRGMGPMRGPPPPMFMPMPQGIRQDPRGMRSYRDLDAPDDEVTVIDYRSL